MKITKFVHACLLIETADKAVLFDPGNYSYESGTIDIAKLPALDYVAITHEHADHCYLPFIEALVQHSPGLTIVTNQKVAALIEGKVNSRIIVEPEANFEFFASPHESLPTGPAPENVGIHFAGTITHPGDSHSFNETKEVLAMPMTAPWGSMSAAIEKIIALKPRVVIPIHDWHWRPEALSGMYERFREMLATKGIDFKIPVDGEPIKL
jgi:L-ascorbate metabolism protein UlaG (beta-lactamase superfamily)